MHKSKLKMISKSTFKLTFIALAVGASLSVSFAVSAQYNPNIQQNFQPNQKGGFQDAQLFQAQSYQQNQQNQFQQQQQNYQNEQAGAAASRVSAAATAAANGYQNPSYGGAAAQFLQSAATASSFAPASPSSGYTNDGTLFMGGQRIGNPHQILHDAEVPSLIGITAVRYSFTDVPTYGQGTLAQIQTDMANAPIANDPTRMFSRLYLTTTNPYVQGVATPHNNYQTYQGILTSASAASFQLTAADDGKMYAFKTLSAPNQQSMNILIKELPNTSQFKGSSDLKGGATGVHVTQNGDAAALSAYMSTLKPYDFSWRSALAPYANDPNTGAFVANWVMGSDQVKAYQVNMQNQSMQTGNEAFGVLAWDANQNKYVRLDPTNQQATSGTVSGNMPTLGNNQFGFFGMHTHPGSATPSNQDNLMTQQLGLDQMVIGTNGTTAIMTNNPSNNWQGQGFEFERPLTLTVSYGGNTAVLNTGAGASKGLYLTVDSDAPYITGVGHYTTVEKTLFGFALLSYGVQGGVVLGDKSTLEGPAYNINVSGGVSGTITLNSDGSLTAISGGAKSPIPGFSVTETNTQATSLTSWFRNTFSGDSTSGANSDGMGNTNGSSKD